MHYHVEIWFGVEPTDIEAAVAEAMAPFSEDGHDNGWWDWYQIGGRWTGAHTPGYEPEKDPANRATCNLCKGTGTRTDMVVPGGCNGCAGTGIKTLWPTEWRRHAGDVMVVEQVPDTIGCAYLVVCPPDGDPVAFTHEDWDPGSRKFVPGLLQGQAIKEFLAARGYAGGVLVTVDCHC